MPRITHFCSCIYVFGCKLSLVRLCDSVFGITPVDITIGITCAAFCFHTAHISFAIIIIIIIIIIITIIIIINIIIVYMFLPMVEPSTRENTYKTPARLTTQEYY